MHWGGSCSRCYKEAKALHKVPKHFLVIVPKRFSRLTFKATTLLSREKACLAVSGVGCQLWACAGCGSVGMPLRRVPSLRPRWLGVRLQRVVGLVECWRGETCWRYCCWRCPSRFALSMGVDDDVRLRIAECRVRVGSTYALARAWGRRLSSAAEGLGATEIYVRPSSIVARRCTYGCM